jgi:diguanylate cyclase (GGDEF)-like protein/PAS domain S-box-containing protein
MAALETCNPSFETLFGFGLEQLNRRGLDPELASDSGDCPIRQASLEVFKGHSVRQTMHYTRSDRVEFDLELNAVPLLRDGQVDAAYLIYEDITQRVKAEKATRNQAESLKKWVRDLQRRNLEMTLLSEMGNLLLCCANADEANQVVDRIARQLFPDVVSGVFYQLKSCRNMLEAAASWGQPVSKSSFLAEDCWGLHRGQPYWSVGTAIPCSHTDSRTVTHDLCVPMMAQGEALGILYLRFPQPAALATPAGVEELRQSRQGLATAVAGQIALSLANLKLRDSLREQSIRDPLTGLFNRRFMQESLDRELQRAARRQRPLSILFLDLDHFKHFNDSFGHEAGDLVLTSIADCFRHNFRGDDIICRYGGEEFAIILPEASTKDAAKRADAFRLQVSSLKLSLHDRPLDAVTISIGIATFPDHGANVDSLLHHADRALYESKARGRNRLTVAKMPPVAGLSGLRPSETAAVQMTGDPQKH